MTGMKKGEGQVIIKPGVVPWPHEERTARALADAGRKVEFVRRSEEKRAKSPDVLIDGRLWEFKSPTADNVKAIQRNLHKALHQSRNVVFDSQRMKRVSDAVVERELRKFANVMRSLEHLTFVNRKRQVIDIK